MYYNGLYLPSMGNLPRKKVTVILDAHLPLNSLQFIGVIFTLLYRQKIWPVISSNS